MEAVITKQVGSARPRLSVRPSAMRLNSVAKCCRCWGTGKEEDEDEKGCPAEIVPIGDKSRPTAKNEPLNHGIPRLFYRGARQRPLRRINYIET